MNPEIRGELSPQDNLETGKIIAEESEEKSLYRLFTPEEVEKAKVWIKENVKDWHDRLNPEVVFLPECSATPIGYAIKEAWKQMYSKTETPKFYRFDPSSTFWKLTDPEVAKGKQESYEARLKEFLGKRLPSGKKTKVLVYDTNIDSESTMDSANYIFSQVAELEKDKYSFETGRKHFPLPVNSTGVFFDAADPYKLARDSVEDNVPASEYKTKDRPLPRFVSPTMKKAIVHEPDRYHGGMQAVSYGSHSNLMYDFRGRIVQNEEAKKSAMDFIHDLKLVGKEAGIEATLEANN